MRSADALRLSAFCGLLSLSGPLAQAGTAWSDADFQAGELGVGASVEPVAEPRAAPRAGVEALAGIDKAYLNRHLEKNLEDSIAEAKSLLAYDPKNPELLWRLGRGLDARGERLPGCKKNDANDPDCHEKLLTFQEGEQALRGSLAQSPDDSMAHYWLARILTSENDIRRTLGLTKATLKELDAAIRLDAGNAGAHRLLGEMLSQIPDVPFVIHGDKHKAVTELETAMKLAPNETANYPALAEGYLAVEDKDDAVKTLRKIFAITAPDDPGACEEDLRDARALLGKLGVAGQ